MTVKTGEMLLKVTYAIDDGSNTVRISHPSLSGVLGFEYTSLDLAHIQLNALRVDKIKSPLEEFMDDTTQLMAKTSELVEAVKTLKGK